MLRCDYHYYLHILKNVYDRSMNTHPSTAVAYYRTSSLTNVGADKDSLSRQRDAVVGYAALHGIEIVREFYDPGISGSDAVLTREGFSAMLAYMLGNGARIVLVEDASRFARDLVVQLTGHDLLKSKGITLIPVNAPTHFEDETPTATLVRSILGAVSQFEKEALVLKLRKSRERKRRETGRCEGNPQWLPVTADVRSIAHDLRKEGLSLLGISQGLADRGMRAASGRAYSASSIKAMLAKPL
jgi:DNA invertase Pin-like site-specific DNA recombinase